MSGFKTCNICRAEFEPSDLFTVVLDGYYVDICLNCINGNSKMQLTEKIYSDQEFLSKSIVHNRYLFCPLCHGKFPETEFIVLMVEDDTTPYGVDGLYVCKGCFTSRFEQTFRRKKPEVVEKYVLDNPSKLSVAEIGTPSQISAMTNFHELLDKVAPRIHLEKFKCQICKHDYTVREMPYMIGFKRNKDGEFTEGSSRICLDCYYKLWKATALRVPNKVYETMKEILSELENV